MKRLQEQRQKLKDITLPIRLPIKMEGNISKSQRNIYSDLEISGNEDSERKQYALERIARLYNRKKPMDMIKSEQITSTIVRLSEVHMQSLKMQALQSEILSPEREQNIQHNMKAQLLANLLRRQQQPRFPAGDYLKMKVDNSSTFPTQFGNSTSVFIPSEPKPRGRIRRVKDYPVGYKNDLRFSMPKQLEPLRQSVPGILQQSHRTESNNIVIKSKILSPNGNAISHSKLMELDLEGKFNNLVNTKLRAQMMNRQIRKRGSTNRLMALNHEPAPLKLAQAQRGGEQISDFAHRILPP